MEIGKDEPAEADALDDGRERAEQDEVGRFDCDVRSVHHRDSDVGRTESRCVVDCWERASVRDWWWERGEGGSPPSPVTATM